MASPALEEDPQNVENLMWINTRAALSAPAASDFLMTLQLTGRVWNLWQYGRVLSITWKKILIDE